MAGLENYLSTLKDNAGIAGGYQQGIRDRTAQDTSLATLAQRQAETQRYTGETPSYLRGQEALARQKELANLQPEAEAGMGVPMDRASLAKKETAISAEKADEIRRQLGPAKTLQILNETEKENAAVLDVADRFLQMYPTADQAIAAFKQKFPQYTQDPQFDAMAARWKGKSSAQASSELTMWRNKIASGIATAKAEQQAELQKIDLQGQNQRDLARIQGQYGLQEAQARAAATETKPTTEQFVVQQLKTLHPNETEQQIAQRYIDYKTVQQKMEESGIPGLQPTVVTTTKGGKQGQSSDPNLAKLPKGSKALGNGIYQLPNGKKVKAN